MTQTPTSDESTERRESPYEETGSTFKMKFALWGAAVWRWISLLPVRWRRLWRLRIRNPETGDDGQSPLTPRIFGREVRKAAKTVEFWRFVVILLIVVGPLVGGAVVFANEWTGKLKPKPYTNSLYHFQIADISGFMPGVVRLGIDCRGTTLADADCQVDAPDACVRLQICYLPPPIGKTDQESADPWTQQVRAITKTLSDDFVVGRPKQCEIGAQKLPGREITVQGRVFKQTTRVVWHMMMTEYEGRTYVIETLCPAVGCGAAEQGIARLINGVEFLSGVVAPGE